MPNEEYQTIEVPAVGEIRARVGTSTLELAGAVKVWHDKAMSARIDGFVGGAAFGIMFSVCSFGAYYLLR